jgi:alkaline phosphatase
MKKRFRRLLITTLAAIALVPLAPSIIKSPDAGQTPSTISSAPKYIFIFLADGGGTTQMEITRQYNRHIHNEGMVITDKIIKEGALGLLTTHAGDFLSTDSAAAATALASGCKGNDSVLGICADGTIPKTVLEVAKEKGMRVGLVTNAAIYDASPAAFIGHVKSRRNYSEILDQYLKIAPDLLLGGGRDQFLPRGQAGGRRKDDVNLIQLFVSKGYQYVSDKNELERIKQGKVLGLFSLQDMSFEIDRDKKTEPSVYDMTEAAIRLLYNGNSRGFAVFIESENVDTAGHLNDVASVIHGYLEFDRAIGLAYEFYRNHPQETLILVTADHETGGLGFTQGLIDLTSTADANRVAATADEFKRIQTIPISLRKASQILGPNPTAEAIDHLMKEYFKGFTLAPELKELIIKRQPVSRSIFYNTTTNALGMMIAHNIQAYWSTSGHTNQPVFVAALGAGSEKFKGYQDNTDFGKNLKTLLERNKSH